MKHATEISYDGGLEQLAIDLGNLRYDALQHFLLDLAHKIRHDGADDAAKGRVLLAKHLNKSADKLLEVAATVGASWTLCKPHTKTTAAT